MGWAWITGASGGIGGAAATALAAQGHDVVAMYAGRPEAAAHTVAAVAAHGRRGIAARVDLADAAGAEAALAALQAAHGCPEVVVHAAGITADGLLARMRRPAWEAVLQVNLNGFFLLVQPLVRAMLRRRSGRIVAVASLSGQRGNAGQVNYAASKAGLIGAVKALALEVAARGITVNAVAPGLIDTAMTAAMPRAALAAQVPLQRFGTPAEVAAAIAYLTGPGGAYVTGQVLAVNGGLYT